MDERRTGLRRGQEGCGGRAAPGEERRKWRESEGGGNRDMGEGRPTERWRGCTDIGFPPPADDGGEGEARRW